MESHLKPAVRWKCWGGAQNENLCLWHTINTCTFNARDYRWIHFYCRIWYTIHVICFRKGHTLAVTPIFLLFHILSPMDYFVFLIKVLFFWQEHSFFPRERNVERVIHTKHQLRVCSIVILVFLAVPLATLSYAAYALTLLELCLAACELWASFCKTWFSHQSLVQFKVIASSYSGQFNHREIDTLVGKGGIVKVYF